MPERLWYVVTAKDVFYATINCCKWAHQAPITWREGCSETIGLLRLTRGTNETHLANKANTEGSKWFLILEVVLTLNYYLSIFDHHNLNLTFLRSFSVTGGSRFIATCQGRKFSGTGRGQDLQGLGPVQTCANAKTVAMTCLTRCPVSNMGWCHDLMDANSVT